jgi:hypothetical protein
MLPDRVGAGVARGDSSAPTPPRLFLQKSLELLENKRVEFLVDAKEFARV